MTFKEYLIGKKIDPEKFSKKEPARYQEFKGLFDQIHPDSFTQQKLFLINQIRRQFKLEQSAQIEKAKPTKPARPKMKPLKPKTT